MDNLYCIQLLVDFVIQKFKQTQYSDNHSASVVDSRLNIHVCHIYPWMNISYLPMDEYLKFQ